MTNETTCFSCDLAIDRCQCNNKHTFNMEDSADCPYCGHQNRACDSDGMLYDENTTSYSCGDCGKEFDVSVSVSYSWTARPQSSST